MEEGRQSERHSQGGTDSELVVSTSVGCGGVGAQRTHWLPQTGARGNNRQGPLRVCDTVSFCFLSMLFLAIESIRHLPNVPLSFLGTSWKANPTWSRMNMICGELATVGRGYCRGILSLPPSVTLRNIQVKASFCDSFFPSLDLPFPTEEMEHGSDLSPTCKGGNIVRGVKATPPKWAFSSTLSVHSFSVAITNS